MSDLISKEKLKDDIAVLLERNDKLIDEWLADCIDDVIDEQPTVDAEPVKPGRWLRTDAYPHRIYCSECYATFIRNDEFLHLEDIPHNYCPNCGAIMDEVEE